MPLNLPMQLNPPAVTLFLIPSHYRASLNVSYDGAAAVVMDGREYRCSAGRVDWRQVYREFVSDTRGSNATAPYFYWAIVLSVTDSEVAVEVQVNERIPKKRALVSKGPDDTPSWRMKKYTEVFTTSPSPLPPSAPRPQTSDTSCT